MKNLFFLAENEQQVYYAVPKIDEVTRESDTNPLASSQRSLKHDQADVSVSKVITPLFKLNTLKFMTSSDLKVATQVKFALVDLRLIKKPSLKEILKQMKKLQDLPILIEIDHNK